MTHLKVKLLTFPSINTGMIGLSATIYRGGRSLTSTSPAKFGTLRELRRVCEKANIALPASSMPAPGVEHSLTPDQLDMLGFRLQLS